MIPKRIGGTILVLLAFTFVFMLLVVSALPAQSPGPTCAGCALEIDTGDPPGSALPDGLVLDIEWGASTSGTCLPQTSGCVGSPCDLMAFIVTVHNFGDTGPLWQHDDRWLYVPAWDRVTISYDDGPLACGEARMLTWRQNRRLDDPILGRVFFRCTACAGTVPVDEEH